MRKSLSMSPIFSFTISNEIAKFKYKSKSPNTKSLSKEYDEESTGSQSTEAIESFPLGHSNN